MSNDPNESSDTAFDSGTVFFARIVDKGVVFNGDLATRIAELLCGAHYGDLDCQRPVSAIDRATYWRVEGSRNREREIDGPGPFFASIEKFDGRVTDLGQWFHLRPHPSVVPLIEEHLRKNPDQGSGDSESNGTIFFANAIRAGVVYSSDLAIRLRAASLRSPFRPAKSLAPKADFGGRHGALLVRWRQAELRSR